MRAITQQLRLYFSTWLRLQGAPQERQESKQTCEPGARQGWGVRPDCSHHLLLLVFFCRVADNHKQNLMTVANLGVVFGPTLLRPQEETVAAIMDIKFQNIVIEILIENHEKVMPFLASIGTVYFLHQICHFASCRPLPQGAPCCPWPAAMRGPARFLVF